MDVIGLASGGKDSCFTMLECARRGHRVVVLANMMPLASEDGSVEQELDSHMIQTVGHTVIEAMAAAMGVPLVRRRTAGKAKHTGVDVCDDFGGGAPALREDDEVFDLLQLLRAAKRAAPTATGVAVGAILSNYQRTRVEHVCRRLGLLPLAMLWRCRQPFLLRRMLRSGMVAVPCKVASLGLSASMLGRPLSEIQPRLADAARKFQVNIAGEGGEYETITLRCPGLFLPGAEVRPLEPVVRHVSRDRFAPVAHIEYVGAEAAAPGGALASQPVLSADDDASIDAAVPLLSPPTDRDVDAAVAELLASAAAAPAGAVSVADTDRVVCVAGASGGPAETDPSAAVTRALASLLGALAGLERPLSWSDVVFVRLWVADMSDFSRINEAYCRAFGRHPPSRACVQAAAGGGGPPLVSLEAVAVRGAGASARDAGSDSRFRWTHHVASQSAWAPLCIGPYCQANVVGGAVLCAGQIGLDPGTMTMVEGGAAAELDQAMTSSARVLAAEGSALQAAVACVVFVSSAHAGEAASLEARTREWMRGDRLSATTLPDESSEGEEEEGGDEAAGTGLDWSGLDMREYDEGQDWGRAAEACPVEVVVVPRLPRDAAVEVEVTAVAGREGGAPVVVTAPTSPGEGLTLRGAGRAGVAASCVVSLAAGGVTEAIDAAAAFGAKSRCAAVAAGSARLFVDEAAVEACGGEEAVAASAHAAAGRCGMAVHVVRVLGRLGGGASLVCVWAGGEAAEAAEADE